MYDLGIVGGGVHGAGVAFHASRRGASTVLFEQRDPAGGPTGRSSAVCRAYYTNPFLAQVAQEGLDALRDFESLTDGRSSGYEQGGVLVLHTAEDEARARAAIPALVELGLELDAVEPDALADLLPGGALDDVPFAVWEPDAGWADPVATTLGLLDRACELGADVRAHTAVRSITQVPGGWRLTAEDGQRVDCRRIVIAAGPWTAPLAEQVGAALPLICERHIVATFAWGTATPFSFSVADVGNGFYAKPEGRDLVCLGSLLPEAEAADPDDFPEEVGDPESLDLGASFLKRLPSMEAIELRRGWASLYDVSPDWMPMIGEIADGVYIDAGTSGHGFKLAPALTRYVADLALDGTGDPSLAQFDPARFDRGEQLVAGFGTARILG
jgi:glycine/D-amino acid oxidase-like deaminating enzyme